MEHKEGNEYSVVDYDFVTGDKVGDVGVFDDLEDAKAAARLSAQEWCNEETVFESEHKAAIHFRGDSDFGTVVLHIREGIS